MGFLEKILDSGGFIGTLAKKWSKGVTLMIPGSVWALNDILEDIQYSGLCRIFNILDSGGYSIFWTLEDFIGTLNDILEDIQYSELWRIFNILDAGGYSKFWTLEDIVRLRRVFLTHDDSGDSLRIFWTLERLSGYIQDFFGLCRIEQK